MLDRQENLFNDDLFMLPASSFENKFNVRYTHENARDVKSIVFI